MKTSRNAITQEINNTRKQEIKNPRYHGHKKSREQEIKNTRN